MPNTAANPTSEDTEAPAPGTRGQREVISCHYGGPNNQEVSEQPAAAALKKKPTSTRRHCCSCRNVSLLVCALILACGIAGLCYYTAAEYSDDEDKFSDYFPFEWTFADEGVLMGEPSETVSIQVTTLDACKQYCEERGFASGNFFDAKIGEVVSVSRRKANCFCMQDFLCVAEMTKSEQGLLSEDAPTGTAFSKTRRVKSPTCAQTYCDFSSSQCN